MQLSPAEIAAMRESFEKLRPHVPTASESFYETLFDLDPKLRPLFREDLTGQGMRFMSALGVIVAHLDDPDALEARLAELGASHAAFGLTEHNYRTMEEALFITVREALGADFTPEAQAAWRHAFRQISDAMMRGGKSV